MDMDKRYNTTYYGERNRMTAYPMGGLGAGMICIEGTGRLSQFSLMNKPALQNDPLIFAAVCIKDGQGNRAVVLEGPVQDWRVYYNQDVAIGQFQKNYGLPRFSNCSFNAQFPFGTVTLWDEELPLSVSIMGWSPFIPGNSIDSCLPVAGLEYTLSNNSHLPLKMTFSFNSSAFIGPANRQGNRHTKQVHGGFVNAYCPEADRQWERAWFSVISDHPNAVTNCRWFRAKNMYAPADIIIMLWDSIKSGKTIEEKPYTDEEEWSSPGASILVPIELQPGESETVRIMLSWYTPESNIRIGKEKYNCYRPWYASYFKSINDVTAYWRDKYNILKTETRQFTDCLYASTLPDEVLEAVTANLTILKSPTVLRQHDGRLWLWEGSGNSEGWCYGSCTHVWNYAQAIAHLFPELERSLRQTEFYESQNEDGHQTFRTWLPIQPTDHNFDAAADGQLGGILKVYRDWRISGDTDWLKGIWPRVRQSLEYCIRTWDPYEKGILQEPHHCTYDIEFWGPDSMCCTIYIAALKAASVIAQVLGEDSSRYEKIYEQGRRYIEERLYNGEYFFQEIMCETARPFPAKEFAETRKTIDELSPEGKKLIEEYGPKYQYGPGCLSDGVLGVWLAEMCGLFGEILDNNKVKSHLESVYRYNFKKNLSRHENRLRAGFAIGNEGGLVLCTWPHGSRPKLAMYFSDEVWTGTEYQVASHMIINGLIEQGLDIVRTCRDRYDGRHRNPFDEIEAGHWYGRALSCYGFLQALSGAFYDAVEKRLYLTPRINGDFSCFISTASGYGLVGVKDGEPFLEVWSGCIDVSDIQYKKYNE